MNPRPPPRNQGPPLYRRLSFPVRRGACGGALVQFQPGDKPGESLPFRIGKVLTMWNIAAGDVRGRHAHYRTEEILVVLRGGCTVDLDNGRGRRARLMLKASAACRPRRWPALLLYPRIWRTLHDFLPDTQLLVIADRVYDENDYLRDRDLFERRAQKWNGPGGSAGKFVSDPGIFLLQG